MDIPVLMIGVWNWLRSYTIDIYWMSLYSVDNIKEKLVISLYAKGMSVSDIEEEMREIYEIELSTSAISIITNKVNQAAQEWQNRPLDPVYLIVWMILPILTFQPINCFGNFVH